MGRQQQPQLPKIYPLFMTGILVPDAAPGNRSTNADDAGITNKTLFDRA